MSSKQALRQWLAVQPPLVTVIAGRVYAQRLSMAQGARPGLTLRRVAVERPVTTEGNTSGVARSTFWLFNWGGGQGPYQDASDLADITRQVLTGSNPGSYGPGIMGAVAYKDRQGQLQSINVAGCVIDGEHDVEQDPGFWGFDRVEECVVLVVGLWHDD